MSDIASSQAIDLFAKIGRDRKDIEMLKATVIELQMKGDENLIIGNLHGHIMALQKSESVTLQKLEATETKCLRLEKIIVQVFLFYPARTPNIRTG